MPVRKTSKNSALKHTPKLRKNVPTTPRNIERSVFKMLERELVKSGHLTFAREAERLCLTASYLRAGGFTAEAKVFSERAKSKALFAMTCKEESARNFVTAEPRSVYAHTVEISDDSMAPTFVKGDLLTINQMLIEKPGDYVLVHCADSDLSVIRRYMTAGDRTNYVPDNPAYPEMLEPDYGGPESLGPVTAVRHADGTIETFDLSSREIAEDWEMVRGAKSRFPDPTTHGLTQ
jgi:SOS-response transcriptional repressor LexA